MTGHFRSRAEANENHGQFRVLRGGESKRSKRSQLLRTLWLLFGVLLLGMALLIALAGLARAGGPKYVAGASFFDSNSKGTPLTWAQGTVNYYTDQGDLSPILPQARADAFVADAFSRWTSVATAAISTTQAGQLGEDVSGQNVIANSDGAITMPADVLPSAVDKPVAIAYDADGKVTDALLGLGAGDSFYCFSNAVFGGLDNFSSDAHLLHALVVINGNCAQSSSQLPDVTYRLVRVLGLVLGLDWSQVNVNVLTRKPTPTAEDYAGFPVMHAADSISCVPISRCYSNADQLKMDDRASISRLYPVTAQNQATFPGKQLFFENTVRIYGSVHFIDANGQPAQPMQGVNVVARWVDPVTGQRSRRYAAASVSGFLFRGYAGNPVNGYNDSTGQRYDRYGSDDPAVEGVFDLAGLEVPNGSSSAQYELSVEALDPLWSQAVGPYGPWQVQPSGTAQPIVVSVSQGGAVQQDVVMQDSATEAQDWREPDTFTLPSTVPPAADWVGSLSGYGDSDYLWFHGQANRTMSVEVTALDASGAATESKALPVVGMWPLSDPPGTDAPAATPFAFNTGTFGVTRLDAMLSAPADFRIGISDYRGDGRPDFRYHARVFYGDTVIPARASVAGGTAQAVQGLGFRASTAATIGGNTVPVLSARPSQLLVTAPPAPDGVQSITLGDTTGVSSSMTDVLTYGAGASDIIRLLAGSNPPTPVGGEAANPISVRVLTADGSTPVNGASVLFSVVPAAAFSVCGGAASCTVLTDESGLVSTRVTVLTAGTMTITAALAPASYPTPKLVQTTLQGTSSALDLVLSSPYMWIAQGATLDVPLTGRVLASGAPLSGRAVNYQVVKGSATLSSSTATTDGNGYVTTTLHIAGLAGDVQVSTCVQPGNSPCQTFSMAAVQASALRLEPVSGSIQIVPVGQSFQPVTVRVTDSSTVPKPVRGAAVVFDSDVFRPAQDTPVETVGETIITRHSAPVILSSSQLLVTSDANGLASVLPSPGTASGAVEIEGTATVGDSEPLRFEAESLWPPPPENAKRKVERHTREASGKGTSQQ